MVVVSQDLIIREVDCAEGRDEIPGMYVQEFTDGKEEIESLQERITGRFSCDTIRDKDGEIIVKANHMITPKRAARIMKDGVDENGEGFTLAAYCMIALLAISLVVGVIGAPNTRGKSLDQITRERYGENY